MNKKIIISCIIFVLAALLLWLMLDLIVPAKLTKLSPTDNQKMIGTDANIELVFNKKIRFNQMTLVINPTMNYETEKKDKNITFNFTENLKANTTYEVRLASQRNFVYQNKKTKTLSWKFTTGADISEVINDMNFGDFFDKNPLARFTPYENSHFRIDWPNDQGVTTITLYGTFNAGVNGPPIEEQQTEYQNQLKAYKQEALNWITSNKIDPGTIKIKWIPEEAAKY